MNNLKTAVMVVLLLGALYGAYQILNQRDVPVPPEVRLQEQQGIAPPMIEFGSPAASDSGPVMIPAMESAPPALVSPAELSAARPSGTLSPPSFAVIPSNSPPTTETDKPERATPPSPDTFAPPTASAPEPPLPADVAAPPPYPERPARAEAVEPVSTSNSDPGSSINGLQPNPFYRPNKTDNRRPESARPSRQITRQAFERAWSDAREQVERGKFVEALGALSAYYNSADLTAAENKQLLRTLDSLAGRVIYSTEHYLAEPHVVRTDETLMDVAAKNNVPYQLLQNINGVRDPLVLLPKSKLKVVPGPFSADVNLTTGELALFVGKYYAGRFPVSVGQDPTPPPGEYAVKSKRDGKDYYLSNGKTIPERHPNNPYGQVWMDLGHEVCIHGSAEREFSPQLGCISLSPIDATDVAGILSVGSKVTIRR